MEIRGLLERELAETLGIAGVVDVPVLPGAAMGTRPDNYVAVIAREAQQKGKSAYLIDLEIYCVVPLDDSNGVERSKSWAASIEAWLQSDECPLVDGSNEAGTIFLHGFRLTDTRREKKERSAAEVLVLVVGASVVYAEEEEEE